METALGEQTPTWAPSSTTARWFEGKDLSEIEILEHGGRHLYPEQIKRRVVKTGQEEAVDVLVRIPSTTEKVRARRDALRWGAELLSLSKGEAVTIDAIRARAGEVYWQHIDNVCLLSHCVFETDEPYRRYALPEILDAHHPQGALYDLLERLDWWAMQEDPRIGDLNEDQLVEIAAAIAGKGHTGPLLAIDGRARESFIVSMASRLSSSPTPKSSSPSPATSTED